MSEVVNCSSMSATATNVSFEADDYASPFDKNFILV